MEAIENDPLLRNFFAAGQICYGLMMNTAMKTFVNKDQKLTGTDIRGVNESWWKIPIDTPFFRDYYKHNNKTPRAKYLNNYIGLGGKKLLLLESESKFPRV